MIDAMKDSLAGLPAHQRLNGTREYLQRLILQSIDQEGLRKTIVFTGGTALRILFGTRRFSEDMDFSLTEGAAITVTDFSHRINARMNQFGLPSSIHAMKEARNVISFFIRFSDVLYPLGLSPDKTHKLAIKVKVDTKPPRGGDAEETLIQDPFLFLVRHFTLPSLFSTKLHALFFRRYTKGRDFYDLVYYLKKNVRPKLELFQNAAAQTHPEQPFPTLESVFDALRNRLAAVDEESVIRDVQPFLMDPAEASYLRKEILLKALDQYTSQLHDSQ